MSLTSRLKAYLEKLYYVPFDVGLQPAGIEPQIEIRPANSNQALFNLKLIFQNRIRLSMELKPQRFSANMVRSMGKASSEQKNAFISFCKLMNDDGAKITFRINEEKTDPLCWEKWPAEWKSIDFRVTIIPVFFLGEDAPDYETTSMKWGGLMTGSVLSLLDVVPQSDNNDISKIEDAKVEGYAEGNRIRVLTNRYERNPTNRLLCLKKYGYKCQICGFDFEEKYGTIGKSFIHVHHIVPISAVGSDYVVDPLRDLIPVCPNCHAMLHTSNPPLLPEELKKHLK